MNKSDRKRVPSATTTEVLTSSRRRCCICFCLESDSGVKTDGQIAHIDRNPANRSVDNLVYLCLRHHDLYDTIRSQSRGITASEIKHYRTELYRYMGTQGPSTVAVHSLTREQIIPSQALARDCKAHGVEIDELVDFVIREATRHPMLFGFAFSSIPLVFRQNVLLVTWDLTCVTVERLLDRTQAYPLNDLWNNCLAAYRQATILAYRQRGSTVLVSDAETRRSIAVYGRLVDAAGLFLSALQKRRTSGLSLYTCLGELFEEAKLAFDADDIGAAIARMEALLSTVHKMILQYAPTGVQESGAANPSIAPQPTANLVATAPMVEEPKHGQLTILVVDDSLIFVSRFSQFLRRRGFTVIEASTTTEALRALVETEFDLVISDLLLGMDGNDGREIALAAKKSSPKTKVIILTAYAEMSREADLKHAGVDVILTKIDTGFNEIMNLIRNVVEIERATATAPPQQ